MGPPLGQIAATAEFGSDADAAMMARAHDFDQMERGWLGDVMSAAARRRSILTRTVKLEVIPELLARHRAAPRRAVVALAVNASQVAELVALTLAPLESRTSGFILEMLGQGITPDALCLDLLAPAARRLGDLWAEDECDFTQVTLGVWRLRNAMRELSHALGPATHNGTTAPRVLLVPLPGEQHSFGLTMVFDFFVRAGWNAWTGPLRTRGQLASMVRREWVDVVGFSLACDDRLDAARAEIRAVRAASRNPGLAVMVGGPPFVANPGLAASVGADGTALDGLQAVGNARALLRRDHERR